MAPRSPSRLNALAIRSRSLPRPRREAAARAKCEKPHKPEAKEGSGDKRNLVLRLALTEEAIRYVGVNRLRFHHHVVRAFPGGAQGRELEAGSAKVEVTLSIAELKRDLEKYLGDFAKDREFPTPLPEIKLDNLAVVAFVQDDGDKSILHAVSVPVESSGP